MYQVLSRLSVELDIDLFACPLFLSRKFFLTGPLASPGDSDCPPCAFPASGPDIPLTDSMFSQVY